jgi:hypothetical protein
VVPEKNAVTAKLVLLQLEGPGRAVGGADLASVQLPTEIKCAAVVLREVLAVAAEFVRLLQLRRAVGVPICPVW